MLDWLTGPSVHLYVRTSIALIAALPTLYFAWWRILGTPRRAGDDTTGDIIAFDSLVFLILGLAAVIAAADRWPAACLWAGAALFAGAFLGLLFGVPYTATTAAAAVAGAPNAHRPAGQQPGEINQNAENQIPGTPPPALAVASPPAPTPPASAQHSQTLLVEAASWFSKFFAGATFAQGHTVLQYFLRLSRSVAGYIVVPAQVDHVAAVGAGLLLYFGLLGFLAGLLIPSYFIKNFMNAPTPAAD